MITLLILLIIGGVAGFIYYKEVSFRKRNLQIQQQQKNVQRPTAGPRRLIPKSELGHNNFNRTEILKNNRDLIYFAALNGSFTIPQNTTAFHRSPLFDVRPRKIDFSPPETIPTRSVYGPYFQNEFNTRFDNRYQETNAQSSIYNRTGHGMIFCKLINL